MPSNPDRPRNKKQESESAMKRPEPNRSSSRPTFDVVGGDPSVRDESPEREEFLVNGEPSKKREPPENRESSGSAAWVRDERELRDAFLSSVQFGKLDAGSEVTAEQDDSSIFDETTVFDDEAAFQDESWLADEKLVELASQLRSDSGFLAMRFPASAERGSKSSEHGESEQDDLSTHGSWFGRALLAGSRSLTRRIRPQTKTSIDRGRGTERRPLLALVTLAVIGVGVLMSDPASWFHRPRISRFVSTAPLTDAQPTSTNPSAGQPLSPSRPSLSFDHFNDHSIPVSESNPRDANGSLEENGPLPFAGSLPAAGNRDWTREENRSSGDAPALYNRVYSSDQDGAGQGDAGQGDAGQGDAGQGYRVDQDIDARRDAFSHHDREVIRLDVTSLGGFPARVGYRVPADDDRTDRRHTMVVMDQNSNESVRNTRDTGLPNVGSSLMYFANQAELEGLLDLMEKSPPPVVRIGF